MKIFDGHTHTTNSHDGKLPPENRVLHAIDEKLDGVFITEHCDWFSYDESMTRKALDDIFFLKEKYKESIFVGAGIELGLDRFYDSSNIMRQLKNYNMDVILGSIHNVIIGNKNSGIFRGAISSSADYDLSVEFLKYYMQDMIYLSKNEDIDVLCHFTYPLRYFNGKQNYGIDIWQYADEICEVFKNIINRQIALELNISGKFTPWDTYLPDECFLKLYKKMGGNIVYLSTDSHTDMNTREKLLDAIQYLNYLGFEYYTVFKDRKAELIPTK